MIILFDSGQMTCDSFKSNGFEEGGDEAVAAVEEEDTVVVISAVVAFSLEFFDVSKFIVDAADNGEEDDDACTADIAVIGNDNVEFFNCVFKLREDEEDLSIDGGLAGTKKIKIINKIN